MAYTLNDKGNLLSRSDLLAGHKEDFTYDAMNRLTAWDVSKSNVSQVNIKFIKQMVHISVIPTQAFRSYPPSLFPIKWHLVANL